MLPPAESDQAREIPQDPYALEFLALSSGFREYLVQVGDVLEDVAQVDDIAGFVRRRQ